MAILKPKPSKKTALIHRGQRISYEELVENINSFASLIDTLPEDRVVIFSENRPEWIYTLYGIWQRGAVAVPIDFMATSEEVAHILRDSTPKLAFCSKQTEETLSSALKLADQNIEVLNFDTITPPRGIEAEVHREREDTALILYTSGTTGNPKGVVLTFKNLLSNIEGIVDAGIASGEDSTLAILPFHHSYPLMVTILVPLHIGATLVFLDKLSPEDIVDKLRTYRVSILVGVPRLYTLFHKRIMDRIDASILNRVIFKLMERIKLRDLRRLVFSKVHKAFGGNIKFMVSGGAKLEPKIAKDFEVLGFTLVEGYGLTETSPIVSFNPPDRIKLGSVGVPIKGVEVRLSKDGEILVRGPNVMKGYWNRPKETEQVLKNGWLYTGDLGEMDEEGYLYIKGRKKEIIVLSTGKNVNPEEIELLILREGDLVKDVGVLEIGGKLHALVYPDLERAKERGVLNIEETIKWEVIDPVNRKLPEWKRIAGFKIVDRELPKTRLGKLKRFLLPKLYQQVRRGKKEQDSSLLETPEGKVIKSFLEKQAGVEVFSSHHIEVDLGLDSLAKVELMSFLEKTFGIKISEEELSRYSTVGELVELVRKRKSTIQAQEINWKDTLESAPPLELPDYRLLFNAGRWILRCFFKTYNRLEVLGSESLPKKPFIIAPNHASYLDAFVIASSLPPDIAKDTYFLGEESYFRNSVASLFGKLAHVITVDVNKNLRESFLKVAGSLKAGKVVVIFPEGARTRTGELMEFKKGVAILSKELDVPVVPTAIKGTYEVWSIYDKFPKPKKIKVLFGKAVYPEGMTYEEITEALKAQIGSLLKISAG